MANKCIVKGCENHQGQGGFVGVLCTPCHTMLTTGKVGHGNTFIHDIVNNVTDAIQLLLVVKQ